MFKNSHILIQQSYQNRTAKDIMSLISDTEKYLSSKRMLNKKAYINIHKHLYSTTSAYIFINKVKTRNSVKVLNS